MGRMFHRDFGAQLELSAGMLAAVPAPAGSANLELSASGSSAFKKPAASGHIEIVGGVAAFVPVNAGNPVVSFSTQSGLGVQPPAQLEIIETYRVTMSRLLDDVPVRLVNVWDGAGNLVGAQLCDSADDLGIAVGIILAEDLRPG